MFHSKDLFFTHFPHSFQRSWALACKTPYRFLVPCQSDFGAGGASGWACGHDAAEWVGECAGGGGSYFMGPFHVLQGSSGSSSLKRCDKITT